jgi:hypothetical protein
LRLRNGAQQDRGQKCRHKTYCSIHVVSPLPVFPDFVLMAGHYRIAEPGPPHDQL